MIVDLSKNKKLTIYKSLLTNFWDYFQQFPMTVSNRYLDEIVDLGQKIVPSDDTAQGILIYIMSTYEKPAACVQHLLNDKFDSLPIEVRPVISTEITDGSFVTAK